MTLTNDELTPMNRLESMTSPDADGARSKSAFIACWACKGPVRDGDLFCQTCKAVQPPGGSDHFTRLGMESRFDVDTSAVEQSYFRLQRQLHPDRFATKTSRERALSQQQATSLNEAYQVLKDPLQRAEYLIHLRGRDELPEGCNLVNDQELLMEAMEMREKLAEAESPDEVHELTNQARQDIERCINSLKKLFADHDLEGACKLTTRLKYLRKLLDETRTAALRLGGTA